ncbi:MAG TPA: A/G-specific adenine glycosylase [Verrucomicrobiae bacterium]
MAALLDWFAASARDLPWRRTHDPYAIWISEIMLQQTQVKTVIPFWERWMRELPTIEAAAHVRSDKLHKLWEGLGYYTRVRNLQKAAQVILEKHGGKFPEAHDDILALPGIGRYTAGAIGSIAFNQPTPLLDGNVIRVLTRIFGIAENPKEKATNARLWQLAEDLVIRAKETEKNSVSSAARSAPGTYACSHLNQSLMELGALICTPRQPQCLICPVKKLCIAFKENRTDTLPNLGKRDAATTRKFTAFIIHRDGKFLVQQRPEGIVNAHLWEFPNVEVTNEISTPEKVFKSRFGFAPGKISPLLTVKHSITRYRITLEAFLVQPGASAKAAMASAPGVWVSATELDALAFSSAHKKLAGAAINSILSDR